MNSSARTGFFSAHEYDLLELIQNSSILWHLRPCRYLKIFIKSINLKSIDVKNKWLDEDISN